MTGTELKPCALIQVLSDDALSALEAASSEQFAPAPDYASAYANDYGLNITESLVVEIYGRPYVQVLEYSDPYIDDGAIGIDPIEGFLDVSLTITFCSVPDSLQPSLDAILGLDYGDYGNQDLSQIISISDLNCGSKTLASLSTNRPGNLSKVFKIEYTAANSQGLNAPPAYRLVAIAPRCTPPEFWCSSLQTPRCSQYRNCILSASLYNPSSIIANDVFVRSPSPGVGTTLPPVITVQGSGTISFMNLGTWT